MVLQSWPFEPLFKNAKLGEMESVSPDDVIWGKMSISSVNWCTRRRMAAIKKVGHIDVFLCKIDRWIKNKLVS